MAHLCAGIIGESLDAHLERAFLIVSVHTYARLKCQLAGGRRGSGFKADLVYRVTGHVNWGAEVTCPKVTASRTCLHEVLFLSLQCI